MRVVTAGRDPGHEFRRRLRERLEATLREMPQDEFDELVARLRKNGRDAEADLVEARRSAWRQLEEMVPKAQARVEQARRERAKPPERADDRSEG